MIRFLKDRLSQAERAHGDGRWAKYLPGIVADHNAETIAGTEVRRSDVNKYNYLKLLGQLYHSTEPSILFNVAESLRAPSGLGRFLWRHAVGDKVLLARRVDYAIKGRDYFEKPSVEGAYGPRVYTVKACRTKLSGDLFICPVYELVELSGLFYESEVTAARFATAEEPRQRRPRRRRRQL
jgi:hypothetical protein